MPVTLIVLVMFYKISKITDNATCLKGSPVPHFFITEFKNLRASFQIHVLFCCRPNSLRWRTTSVVLWSSSIRCVQIQEANLQCCTMSCQYLVFKLIQSNLSTMAILGTEKSGLCGEVAITGRWYGSFFLGSTNTVGQFAICVWTISIVAFKWKQDCGCFDRILSQSYITA